ncbi:MAG: 4-hydroxy-tetrahydrodipicolinate synthase [Planctomycetes bacterium]|nr:4-hydroxy-tetrahydrodipicolinate synthase [Planctomycetota bacterium]
MTALVTPFHDGDIDWPRVDMLVDRQIEGGTDWLVPCGTTGEAPTLTADEHHQLLEAVLTRAAGRRPVMAGTGTNSTAETVRRTRLAQEAGADAALVVAPYYNRPTEEGLYRHFASVADAVDLPIVLYNVPIRTGVNIPTDVVVRLRRTYPHVVGLKHATGSVDGVTDLMARCDIAILSGDDPLTWPLMSLGAGHRRVYELAIGLDRFGPNPLPIKSAMALAGLLNEEFRLPLCGLGEDARQGIERLLVRMELLEAVHA